MFDCEKCQNLYICKLKDTSQEVQKQIQNIIDTSQEGFCGRIEVNCDYFASIGQNRNNPKWIDKLTTGNVDEMKRQL